MTTSSAPPLERIAPFITSVFSVISSGFSTITRLISFSASQTKFLAVFSPVAAAFYLLAPLVVFLGIATDVLVRWPYRITLYALDNFYPIYVFCGVACIVGGLVGITGRLLSGLLVDIVNGRTPEESEDASGVKKGKRVVRRSRSR